jgi:hypothetical protein
VSYGYPYDFAAWWNQIAQDIAATRLAIGLPALNGPDGAGSGSIAVGQEFKPYQLSPPSITIQPMGADYRPPRHPGSRDDANAASYVAFARWWKFRAFLWGDEASDTTGVTPAPPWIGPAWNSATELERELLISLVKFSVGIPAVRPERLDVLQPEDVTKLGRMLVLDFALESPVADVPWLALPYATSTTAGVVVEAEIVFVSADGTSSTQIGIVTSPSSTDP